MVVFTGLGRFVNPGICIRVALVLLVGFLMGFYVSVVVAQEESEAEPTGKLVLVPADLYVGETTDALGFHLDFPRQGNHSRIQRAPCSGG